MQIVSGRIQSQSGYINTGQAAGVSLKIGYFFLAFGQLFYKIHIYLKKVNFQTILFPCLRHITEKISNDQKSNSTLTTKIKYIVGIDLQPELQLQTISYKLYKKITIQMKANKKK